MRQVCSCCITQVDINLEVNVRAGDALAPVALVKTLTISGARDTGPTGAEALNIYNHKPLSTSRPVGFRRVMGKLSHIHEHYPEKLK
jgi:hypothetical protein